MGASTFGLLTGREITISFSPVNSTINEHFIESFEKLKQLLYQKNK